MTDLDQAHAAMETAPEDDTARLRFYERLADTELFMLLGAEAVTRSRQNCSRSRTSALLLCSTGRNDCRNLLAGSLPMPEFRAGAWRRCWQGRGLDWR